MLDQARLDIINFSRHNPLGSVATISATGDISDATVYIFAHDDFTFYFGTRTSTQKAMNINDNPKVALAVSNAHTLETLQIRGIAEAVMDPVVVRDLLSSLRTTFAHEKQTWMTSVDAAAHGIYQQDVSLWVPPVSQMHEGNYIFFRISPTWARYRKYDSDPKAHKEITEILVTAAAPEL